MTMSDKQGPNENMAVSTSLKTLPHSNEQEAIVFSPLNLQADYEQNAAAHSGNRNENLEDPTDDLDNALQGDDDESNLFSLSHKNYHGSIDLGLDEKLTSMTGSYSEILDSGDHTGHEQDGGCIHSSVSTYLSDMQEFHNKLDKRKGFGVKEVLRGDVVPGESNHAECSTAQGLSNDASQEDGVPNLVRDFPEKINMIPQSSRRRDYMKSVTLPSANLSPRTLLFPSLPPFDPRIIADLEDHARNIATSMDTLIENLTGTLHSISALTVDCVETYRDAVCKTCDAVDSNIKSMYQLMAKCEELSKSMKPVYKLQEQIREIRRLLDLFEGVAFSGGS